MDEGPLPPTPQHPYTAPGDQLPTAPTVLLLLRVCEQLRDRSHVAALPQTCRTDTWTPALRRFTYTTGRLGVRLGDNEVVGGWHAMDNPPKVCPWRTNQI